jgi:uncharacterized protein (TIGR03083 family)
MQFSERYDAAHRRWVELLRTVDDDQQVPCVAPWTVRDLLAHVVGLADDVASGNLGDWSSEDWTAAQVDQRADRSRAEVLAEWAELTPRLCAMFDDLDGAGLDPLFARMTVVDVTVHEDDILEALGTARPLDPADWSIVGAHRREMLDGLIAMAGLPALRIRTDEGDDWTVGGDIPEGGVTLSRQELLRSLCGRRPRATVRSYNWSVDPEPYLPAAWVSPSLRWPDDPTG